MSNVDIVIAGSGALGAVAALVVARTGRVVTVVDPAPVGANASGVAAGMLAPAFESLFDSGDYRMLAAARDLWPALAADIALPLHRQGAEALGEPADVERWAEALHAAGAAAEIRRTAALSSVFTVDDWRLD